MSLDDHVPCKFVSCGICGPALAAKLSPAQEAVLNEDISWMTHEDLIGHYQGAMMNWSGALDERDKAEKECKELRELLIAGVPEELVCYAIVGCPECGETMTSRLGTELKIQLEHVQKELTAERDAHAATRAKLAQCESDWRELDHMAQEIAESVWDRRARTRGHTSESSNDSARRCGDTRVLPPRTRADG